MMRTLPGTSRSHEGVARSCVGLERSDSDRARASLPTCNPAAKTGTRLCMPRLGSLIRQWLAKRGLLLFRADSPLPPTLKEYFGQLRGLGVNPTTVLCFDSELQIQTELLSIFAPDQIRFIFDTDLVVTTLGEPGSVRAERGTTVVEIDAEEFDLEQLFGKEGGIEAAGILLVRSHLAHFWSGKGDLCELIEALSSYGYEIYDVLDYVGLPLLSGTSGRIVIAFEKKSVRNEKTTAILQQPRTRRLADATTLLSKPIARSADLKRLAGRGSFGFAAGVINPGAIEQNGEIHLVCRGEHLPWAIHRSDETEFFRSCQPLHLRLNADLAIASAVELSVDYSGDDDLVRREDFRLFRHKGKLCSNHSSTTPLAAGSRGRRPVQLDSLQTRVTISEVKLQEGRLNLLGFPTLDRPIGLVEKNWAMFSHEEDLFLIYSFNPYCLLRAKRWPGVEFETVAECEPQLEYDASDLPLRNSANPVDYDSDHLLHMVHRVLPGKQYAFWAVLIAKRSLLPVMISVRPLVQGWHSAPASIIYACSLVPAGADIRVFAGINDSSCGYWNVPRTALDAEWIPIFAAKKRPRGMAA